jgi:hypothetical protein
VSYVPPRAALRALRLCSVSYVPPRAALRPLTPNKTGRDTHGHGRCAPVGSPAHAFLGDAGEPSSNSENQPGVNTIGYTTVTIPLSGSGKLRP